MWTMWNEGGRGREGGKGMGRDRRKGRIDRGEGGKKDGERRRGREGW